MYPKQFTAEEVLVAYKVRQFGAFQKSTDLWRRVFKSGMETGGHKFTTSQSNRIAF